MPAIVVRYHGEGGVADLGFARQLRLGQVGHADQVHAPGAIGVRFGQGRESRALHAHVSAAAMASHFMDRAGAGQRVHHPGAKRPVEAHVRHEALAEERGDATHGAVEKLRGQRHISRLEILAQGAHGAQRDDLFDAELFHAVNVGAEVDLGRHQHVAASMPGQKRHPAPFQLSHHVNV